MIPAWQVNEVYPIDGEREQFAHVAKHLYRLAERWEQVVPGLNDASGRALASGCTPANFAGKYPDCRDACPACREHVLRDHEHAYEPAYREALRDAHAAHRFGRLKDDGNGPGWAFVDRLGVYVIVAELRKKPPKVRTAYRVLPPHGAATMPDDFFKAAVRRLRDKSSYEEKGTR